MPIDCTIFGGVCQTKKLIQNVQNYHQFARYKKERPGSLRTYSLRLAGASLMAPTAAHPADGGEHDQLPARHGDGH